MQCVRTRVNLALVSKLWRDASKPAAAYPLEFDVDAFPDVYTWTPGGTWTKGTRIIHLMDNDEALSLPYERVVGLLGDPGEYLCDYAAIRGSVRLLKWARENNRDWSTHTCYWAARNGHLPALKYLHENGCPWNREFGDTCYYAALRKHWDCLQYLVDNKCLGWKKYAKDYAEHLR